LTKKIDNNYKRSFSKSPNILEDELIKLSAVRKSMNKSSRDFQLIEHCLRISDDVSQLKLSLDIEKLKNDKVNSKFSNDFLEKLLSIAAKHGRYECCAFLISSYDLDINAQNNNGFTVS
jgi:hypothetical protein